MQRRALKAVRETNRRIVSEHGRDAIWVAVSHGDVIKAILSDAAGAHLDDFQRIQVDPASVSVVRYTPRRPFVLRLNDTGGELRGSGRPTRTRRAGPTARAVLARATPWWVAARAPERCWDRVET